MDRCAADLLHKLDRDLQIFERSDEVRGSEISRQPAAIALDKSAGMAK